LSPAVEMSNSKSFLHRLPKRAYFILLGIFIVIAIGLGVGLGVGLSNGSNSESPGSPPITVPPNNTTNQGTFWTPTAGTSWDIVLLKPISNWSRNISIYDIDLFDNNASAIADLHAQDHKVICYFSAGSYEEWRSDAGDFSRKDYSNALQGWKGEYWLDTNSVNVRNIMRKRIALAASKGCDGVDPDNVDGYDNNSGFHLDRSSAVDYLTFLASESHGHNMSIGLKNSGSIVNATIDMMQWAVNEQCVEFKECNVFQPFIVAGKPVFHIEYPKSAPSLAPEIRSQICGGTSTSGFSTLIKEMDLGEWVEHC
jgi:hypothetical protein